MFAENFKRICEERGTTPSAIVKSLHYSTSKVTLWNNGSLPKEEMLEKLAKELNCEVYEFFIDEKARSKNINDKTVSNLNDDEKDILNYFGNLSRREKHLFMAKIYEEGR